MPAAISSAARMAEWCAGFGLGGRAERASATGTRATGSPRPPGGGGRPEDGDEDDHRQQRPGQAEPVDAMADGGLERRGDREPQREPHDRSDQRADRAHDRAVGQQTSRRCFSVAPIAASMPSWRSRRCAITAKPAAAISVARSRKTVATENIASASAARFAARASDPANADLPCSGGECRKASTQA